MLRINTLALLSTSALLNGCVIYAGGSLDVGDDDFADTDVVGSTENGGSDDSIMDDTGEDGTTDGGDPTDTDGDECAEAIDILFVIDNSGSMGEEQGQVSAAIGSMVSTLELAGMDWRIAVTTTDNGNPWCPAGATSPEAGKFVASSCRDRLDGFLFSDTVDVQDIACNNVCNYADIEIASTVIDGVVRPGTWVERVGGVPNTFRHEGDEIVEVDPVEALRCILPQGVNGCGFESQLESMNLALKRTADVNEDQFGFLRPGAQLAVVIISDETDCSYNKDWSDIFAQDGNKVFWTDPNGSFPTSGVCWNAGIECVGEGPEYDDCVARNKDIEGNDLPDGNDPQAVLHPLARYTDFLTALETSKQAVDPAADVLVFGIVGVELDGSLQFVDVTDTDPAFQDSFGIGPGCVNELVEGDPSTAVPPGRMREVIGEFDGSMHSVCKDQYIDAFKTIANRVTVDCQP